MLSLISTIAGGLFGLGKEWFSNKREVSQAKHQARIKAIEATADWESKMAEGSIKSWKDEWFTIMISTPFVTLFLGILFDVPELVERTKEAFVVLRNDVPDLYWTLLIIAFSASFGIKPMVKGVSNLFSRDGK